MFEQWAASVELERDESNVGSACDFSRVGTNLQQLHRAVGGGDGESKPSDRRPDELRKELEFGWLSVPHLYAAAILIWRSGSSSRIGWMSHQGTPLYWRIIECKSR